MHLNDTMQIPIVTSVLWNSIRNFSNFMLQNIQDSLRMWPWKMRLLDRAHPSNAEFIYCMFLPLRISQRGSASRRHHRHEDCRSGFATGFKTCTAKAELDKNTMAELENISLLQTCFTYLDAIILLYLVMQYVHIFSNSSYFFSTTFVELCSYILPTVPVLKFLAVLSISFATSAKP